MVRSRLLPMLTRRERRKEMSGSRLNISLDSPAMILGPHDASQTIALGDHAEDVLNSIALNHNASKVAWTSDEGNVGVLDLVTLKSTRMRVKHANVRSLYRAMASEELTLTTDMWEHRPGELVSGGYDCALLHFDTSLGSLLSRFDVSAAVPPESGVSLSPPFILSTALSPAGILAAGTADGRILLGTAGEKLVAKKGKGGRRSRKWEGLKEDGMRIIKAAEGPIVAMTFVGTGVLLSCTLLGSLMLHRIVRPATDENGDESVELAKGWSKETCGIAKVNAIAFVPATEGGKIKVAVGGVGKNGKGIAELLLCEI
ncbi:hypothetical protein HWV62_9043 [Athelia sp. TMB]|nr:hypothetical protein HWV62_9043 [Athelia sp. TMB]